MSKRRAYELADHMRYMPRDERDLEIARMLECMSDVYALAWELVKAKTHQQSVAVFAEMKDTLLGKKGE